MHMFLLYFILPCVYCGAATNKTNVAFVYPQNPEVNDAIIDHVTNT